MSGTNVDLASLTADIAQMYRFRAFERIAVEALKEGLIPGPVHPSIGQEACAVGVVG